MVTIISVMFFSIQTVIAQEQSESQEIPDWVKNNAKWWSQGLITDSDYVAGIQYLLRNGIIPIGPTENTEQATIPKEISSYKLAKHDATNIKQQIDNKKNISITLGNNTYDLELVPNPIRSEDFKAVLTVNGKHIEVPPEQVNTYKGKIIGQDFSDLRITISRDSISGFIKTENDDKFYIEPLRNFKPDANRLDHVVYTAKDIKDYFELGDDFTLDQEIVPIESVSKSYITLLSESAGEQPPIHFLTHKYTPVITIKLALDCDKEFYNLGTTTWQSRQLSVINDASSTYNSQLDVPFSVVAQTCDMTNSKLISSDRTGLMTQLKDRWITTPLPSPNLKHSVHLYTGKNMVDGATPNIGYGNLGGMYISPTNNAFSYVQQISESGYSATAYAKEVMTSHEIGHTMGAPHQNAHKICVLGSPCLQWKHTVMWEYYMGDGAMMDIFSDGTVSASQNNEQTIRNNAVYINNNILPH